MARRRTTLESKQTGKEIESQEEIREELTAGRGTALATPSSWWEERKRIERPRAEEQERRYREEQERYGQERQRAKYYRPIQETWRTMQETERPGAEEPKDIFRGIESTGEMYSKAAELSRNATPENYRAFYDEWVKTYQNTFSKLYPVMTRQFDRETIEKLMSSAEESRALFQSWVAMLDENSRKTQELLQGTPDPEKYRELFDMWIGTYGKIYEDFVEMPAKGSTKEVLETYGGIPGTYLGDFAQMAKLWRDAYSYLYRPWVDSMLSLSRKMSDMWMRSVFGSASRA